MNLYDLSIGEDKMNQFLSIALKTHFESLKVSGKGENYWQCYQAFLNYCDIYGDCDLKENTQKELYQNILINELRIIAIKDAMEEKNYDEAEKLCLEKANAENTWHYRSGDPEEDRPEDIEAARKAYFSLQEDDSNWTWNVSWWSDPVLLGHYPEEGLERYEKYLPKITEEDMRLISEPIDIYGQNIYNGRCIRMGEDGKPQEVC